MKTGNGYKPNTKGTFQGGMKKDSSNIVKPSTGKAFSAKKSTLSKKK